jgi:hypothetical protein
MVAWKIRHALRRPMKLAKRTKRTVMEVLNFILAGRSCSKVEIDWKKGELLKIGLKRTSQ